MDEKNKNIIDLSPVISELLEVLAKHKIPINLFEEVLELLRTQVGSSTIIQKNTTP